MWASGSFASPRLSLPRDPLASVGWQMLLGGIVITVAGLALGEGGDVDVEAFSARSLLALAYLIVFGSWVAFTAYAWLLQNAPISKVATYAYVNPVVAIALGWLVLDEVVTQHDADRRDDHRRLGRARRAHRAAGRRQRRDSATAELLRGFAMRTSRQHTPAMSPSSPSPSFSKTAAHVTLDARSPTGHARRMALERPFGRCASRITLFSRGVSRRSGSSARRGPSSSVMILWIQHRAS